METIQWYKVKCSFYNEEFAVRSWEALMAFMKHNIGFDYNIKGMYGELPNDIPEVVADKDANQGWSVVLK